MAQNTLKSHEVSIIHGWLYSGFDSDNGMLSSEVSYWMNQLKSYNTVIATMRPSAKQKRNEYKDGKSLKKKVPTEVIFIDTTGHSAHTRKQVEELVSAVPPYMSVIRLPLTLVPRQTFIDGDSSLERIASQVYKRACEVAKHDLSTKNNVETVASVAEDVRTFEFHFGKKYAPNDIKKFWEKVALIEDPDKLASHQKEIRKEKSRQSKKNKLTAKWECEVQEVLHACHSQCSELQETLARKYRTHLNEVEKFVISCVPESIVKIHGGNLSGFAAAAMLYELKSSLEDTASVSLLSELICKAVFDSEVTPHSAFVTPVSIIVAPTVECEVVSKCKMITHRGIIVRTAEVRRFLRMYKGGKQLTGHQFTQGYRFLSSGENGMIRVGCHTFSTEVVDALADFMLREDEEIQADFQKWRENYQKLRPSLKERIAVLAADYISDQAKIDQQQLVLKYDAEVRTCELQCKMKEELKQKGLN